VRRPLRRRSRCRVPGRALTLAVMENKAVGRDFRPNTMPIALHVDDVDAARAEREAAGVTFLGDTFDTGVCRQAIFTRPRRQPPLSRGDTKGGHVDERVCAADERDPEGRLLENAAKRRLGRDARRPRRPRRGDRASQMQPRRSTRSAAPTDRRRTSDGGGPGRTGQRSGSQRRVQRHQRSPTALPEIVGGVVFVGAAAPIGGAATHGIPVRDRFFACATGCLRGVLLPG
jgi:hypothetical protein